MKDTHSEPLTGLDSWFLYAERHEAPLHIGATYIFEGTPRVKGARGALGLAQTIGERLHLVPRYRVHVISLTDLGPVGQRLVDAGIAVEALGMARGRLDPRRWLRLCSS